LAEIAMSKRPSSSGRGPMPDQPNRLPDRGFYWIRVKGCLDGSWSEWFDGLVVTADCESAETVISGEVQDQAALHGLLIKVRNLGLTLVEVTRQEPAATASATITRTWRPPRGQ
jgi:hypothetical protein